LGDIRIKLKINPPTGLNRPCDIEASEKPKNGSPSIIVVLNTTSSLGLNPLFKFIIKQNSIIIKMMA
jgi:hypothetical protein